MIDEKKLIEAVDKSLEKDSFYLRVVFKEIVNKQPKVGEWIPVSERLPEDGEEVLVWFEYFRYGNYNCLYQTRGISYMFDGKWSGFVNGTCGWQKLRIIAWMPLPEPYKESEE